MRTLAIICLYIHSNDIAMLYNYDLEAINCTGINITAWQDKPSVTAPLLVITGSAIGCV